MFSIFYITKTFMCVPFKKLTFKTKSAIPGIKSVSTSPILPHTEWKIVTVFEHNHTYICKMLFTSAELSGSVWICLSLLFTIEVRLGAIVTFFTFFIISNVVSHTTNIYIYIMYIYIKDCTEHVLIKCNHSYSLLQLTYWSPLQAYKKVCRNLWKLWTCGVNQ